MTSFTGKIWLLTLSCFLFLSSTAICQAKKHLNKSKGNNSKEKPLVFHSEEAFQKWAFQDSVKRSREDSINYIKDSLQSEAENKKWNETYQAYLHPPDSLHYVDEITQKLIIANSDIEADSAVKIITSRFSGALQRARAIFFWIAATVRYDHNAFSNNLVLPIFNNDLDAVYTFKNKKGVCQNYANLFRYMCSKCGVECYYITGAGKNFPYAINPTENSNHAWNSIKINNRRMLLDVTWAASGNQVDNYWFNTNPEEFIYNHFPEDSALQFVKHKINKKDFLNLPVISPALFRSKIDFDIPKYGKLRLNDKYFFIEVPASKKDYSITYTITPYAGDDWRSYDSGSETKELDTKVIPGRNMTRYQVEVPKGIWLIAVDINRKVKGLSPAEIPFSGAIIFRIAY